MRKRPNFSNLSHFSDDQIAPLIPKIGNKIEKIVLLDQFHTGPSTFSLSLRKVMDLVHYFIISPCQTWCYLELTKISFFNLYQSKVIKEKPLGLGSTPPLGIRRVNLLLEANFSEERSSKCKLENAIYGF